jgi:sugar phosphate isomerase/epimerase
MVKVFAAWPGLVNDEEAVAMYAPYERGSYFKRPYPPDLRRWHRAVDGLREVAHWAADLGITLVLQNHAPVTAPGYEDALAMMQEIDRPNVRLCLDAPLFQERQDDAYVREAVRQCRDLIAYTHYGAWNFREGADGQVEQGPAPSFGGRINYEVFLEALAGIGYDGYLSSEYCVAAVERHRIVGIEEVDRGTRLALTYMRGLVERVVRERRPPRLTRVATS